MASIRLRKHETRDGDLPGVCMKCGAAATVTKPRTFSWHPQWVVVLIVFGLLPFLIAALLTTKRMKVFIPLCDAHKNHWLNRNLAIWLGFFGLVPLAVVACIAFEDRPPGGGEAPLAGYLCAATLIGLVVWLIFAVVLSSGMIRAAEITDRSIKLNKVSKAFAAAVVVQRGLYDDEDDDDDYEYDDRPRRRPRAGDDD